MVNGNKKRCPDTSNTRERLTYDSRIFSLFPHTPVDSYSEMVLPFNTYYQLIIYEK